MNYDEILTRVKAMTALSERVVDMLPEQLTPAELKILLSAIVISYLDKHEVSDFFKEASESAVFADEFVKAMEEDQ
jgi:hypothetical protein